MRCSSEHLVHESHLQMVPVLYTGANGGGCVCARKSSASRGVNFDLSSFYKEKAQEGACGDR